MVCVHMYNVYFVPRTELSQSGISLQGAGRGGKNLMCFTHGETSPEVFMTREYMYLSLMERISLHICTYNNIFRHVYFSPRRVYIF